MLHYGYGGCAMSGFGKQRLTGTLIFLGSVGALGNIRKGSVTKLISEGNEYYIWGVAGHKYEWQ